MVGRIMTPKDIFVLTPGTCKYNSLQGKKELKLQMEFKLLIS